MFAAPEVRDGQLPLGTRRQHHIVQGEVIDTFTTPDDPPPDGPKADSYLHLILRDQLTRREMSVRDLAKACGTTTTVVSRWVSADPQRRVVPESRGCVQLARALDLPVVEVLVAAGRIPPTDGRPPHPHEADIRRLTLALDLALRRIPQRSFIITAKIAGAFIRSLTQVSDELIVDEITEATDRD